MNKFHPRGFFQLPQFHTCGIPATSNPVPVDFPRNPWDSRHPHSRAEIGIIKDKSNVLFYLPPAKRDIQLTTRLRRGRQYPTIYAQTNRCKNTFILFGLNHFQ